MVGINANVNALNASVKLSGNAMEQTTAMQRLGTGARVNSAKDDTVALAVSTGLIAQIKGMAVATRNVADGISLAQTAESALASVVTILQHMRELTLQAANGTLSSQNRQTMELEFDQNINQINHVLETSHFNGIKLFDGSALSLQIQSGANLNNINNISIPKINTFSLLGATPTRDDKSNEILAPEINTVTKYSSYFLSNTNNNHDPIYIDPNITLNGSGTLEGATVMIRNADIMHDVLMMPSTNGITSSYDSTTGILTLSGTASVAAYQAALRVVQFKTDAHAQTGKRDIQFTLGNAIQGSNGHFYQLINNSGHWFQAKSDADSQTYFGLKGYLATITSQEENDLIAGKLRGDAWIGATDDYNQINAALGYQRYADQASAEGNWYWVDGPEKGQKFLAIDPNNGSSTAISYSHFQNGEPNNWSGVENFGEIFSTLNGAWNDLNALAPMLNVNGAVVEFNGTPDLKISANTIIDVGSNAQTVLENQTVPINAPTISPRENAALSLQKIDEAIGDVVDIRSYLGAVQHMFQSVIDHLTSSGVNAQLSNGRLIDTDYAETATQLSRSHIISQAATAILAQANQSSQLVLQLLKP